LKLLDLRRIAIRQNTQVRFRMRNGMDCVITEAGIAQVPAWKGVPEFNLEEELEAANSFLLEPVVVTGKGKTAPLPRSVGKAELSEMASRSTGAAAAPDHEDE
jgi:hypothetical protein